MRGSGHEHARDGNVRDRDLDSGTGELRGEAWISVGPDGGHSFTLDYDFE